MSSDETPSPPRSLRASRWHTWSMCDEIAAALLAGDAPVAVCARYGVDRAELARIVGAAPRQAVVSW